MTGLEFQRYDLPLLRGLTPDELDSVNFSFQERNLRPWEILFNQQDRTRDVYFLLSGALLAVYWTEDGREVIFSQFTVGSYFGELAALDDGDRSLAVVAKRQTRIAVIPQACFLEIFNRFPIVRDRIIRGLVSRIRILTKRNLELATLTVEQRVATYLLGIALEQNQLVDGGVIRDAPTHAEIAASIGANREVVSRTMTHLGRKGAIKTARKRIEICNPSLLSEIV